VGLKFPGILEENLWSHGRESWEIPWDSCIGCSSLPDEIRKLGGENIRVKFENKINFECVGDSDENSGNCVGRRFG
jgi:hypothetical protein